MSEGEGGRVVAEEEVIVAVREESRRKDYGVGSYKTGRLG